MTKFHVQLGIDQDALCERASKRKTFQALSVEMFNRCAVNTKCKTCLEALRLRESARKKMGNKFCGDWEIVLQICKVEEPIQPAEIARRIPQQKMSTITATIDEMSRVGLLRYDRDDQGRLIVLCRD